MKGASRIVESSKLILLVGIVLTWSTGIFAQVHQVPGMFGNGLCFNGIDEYVLVPNSSSLNVSGALTIEAWINLAELPTVPEFAIVSKWAGTGSAGGRYLFGVIGGATPGRLLLNLQDVGAMSTQALSPGQWYHVAVTYDGSQFKFYINGQLDNTVAGVSSFGFSTTPLAIGKNIHNNITPSVNPYYFKGVIDEVRISNIARTSFCLNSPCNPDLNTVALWHLDEQGGNTVSDASGNNNNGSIQGTGCQQLPPSVAFCDDFEDGNGWQTRWANIYGTQTLVSSPTHTGNGALKFRGSNFGCHSVLQRANFEAAEGIYSAWFNQQHYEAGVWMNIQVQSDTDVHPNYRPCYVLELSAQNAQHPSFVLRRNDGQGGSDILLNMSPPFNMNEWIRMFIRRELPSTLIVGCESNNQIFTYTVVDPNPITLPGGFYISSCSDGPPTDNFYDDVCYNPLGPETLQVAVDIKPQSCPNPLNTNDMGVLPVAILGISDFDVSQIVPSSVKLEGITPVNWSMEDVSTPIPDSDDTCFCHTLGADGFVDLVLHFSAQQIVSALGSYSNWETRALTLTGELLDSTSIEGKDCIRIQIPKRRYWRGMFGKGEAPINAGYITPAIFELHPNYPNPFNATTTISYSLPANSDVTIDIYNISGQKVRTLVSGFQTAGYKTVTWDGTNESGQPVSSGIYFYRIKAGEITEAIKMTLLK